MTQRGSPVPIEAAQAWPTCQFRQTGASEWHSDTCPQCGTSGKRSGDRFLVRADGVDAWTGEARVRGWCRQCRYFAFATSPDKPIDAAEIARWQEQQKREQAIRAEERARRVTEFTDAELWRELHRRMGPAQYEWWREAGIPHDWADWWQLGHVDARTFAHDGALFSSSAYAIPIFDAGQASADSTQWHAINCQYRIENPPAGVGKYRQEPGLPAAAFVARPDQNICGSGIVLVVEGAKKAAVSYLTLADANGDGPQVIGLPGVTSWAGIPARIAGADTVYVALDPDDAGRKQAPGLAREIGKAARVVTLPDKIDDMALALTGDGADARGILQKYMQIARIAR